MALSLLSLYAPLTSCKISKKSKEPIQRKVGYGQTDRPDGQIDSTEFIGPSDYAGGPKRNITYTHNTYSVILKKKKTTDKQTISSLKSSFKSSSRSQSSTGSAFASSSTSSNFILLLFSADSASCVPIKKRTRFRFQ